MPNAVIYARYSSERQNEQSIEGQLSVCQEYAERCGYNVIEEYVDRALTGKTDRRPSFLRMIEDSKKRQFEYVIVYKLDRFSRNRYDSATYRHILKLNGVRILSAQEQISDSPEGIILEAMLEAYNEYYSIELAQKVKRGNKQNIEKGLAIGGKTLLGYQMNKDKTVSIIEKEAEIVRFAFTEYAQGSPLRKIAEALNARGCRTKNGNQWDKQKFQTILRNRKYTGEFIYECETYTNIYPAIVDMDVYEKVQTRLNSYRHTRARTGEKMKYLLAGKIFCGNCGNPMVGECGKSQGGTFYHYYTCAERRYGNHACAKTPERKGFIEWYICEQTIEWLKMPGNIEHVSESVAKLHNEESNDSVLRSLRAKISDAESELRKVADKFIEADQPALIAALNEKAKTIDDEMKELKAELAKQRLLVKLPLKPKEIAAWLKTFTSLDIMEEDNREKIIDSLINAIYLSDDKIVIYFNVKEAKLVSFIEFIDDMDKLDESSLVRNENGIDHQ